MIIYKKMKLIKGEKYYFQINDNETYPRTIQVPMSPTEIPVCTETMETWGTLTSTSLISDYNGSPVSCSADISRELVFGDTIPHLDYNEERINNRIDNIKNQKM